MKKQIKAIVLLLILFSLYACSESTTYDPIPQNKQLGINDTLVFSINPTEDTLLTTEQGTTIKIPAHTFSKDIGGIVEIRLVEILDKYAMMMQGISTITIDRKVLESGGMVYMDVHPQQEFQNEVSISLSSRLVKEGMQKFVGVLDSSEVLTWQDPQNLAYSPGVDVFKEGEMLFRQNCASCHSTDLRAKLTGPALGNVTLFRSEGWLKEYTRNSQSMIGPQGDTLANCIWQLWAPVVMTSFEKLSDTQIESIYFYIQNLSQIQNIGKNEVNYVTDCALNFSESSSEMRSMLPSSDRNDISSSEFVRPFSFSDYLKYTFNISNPGWYNVDRFFKTEETIPIESFVVEVKSGKSWSYLGAWLVYEDIETVICIPRNNNSTLGVLYRSFRLPAHGGHLIVLGEDNNKVYLSKTELEISSKEVSYQVELEEYDATQLKEFKERLKHK